MELLYEGPDILVGTIEVLYRGHWGIVCDFLFDDLDAGVVCRQLGYRNGSALAANCCTRAYDEIPIVLNEIQCMGFEDSIAFCPHKPWGINNCYKSEAAAVRCSQRDAGIHLSVNVYVCI